MKNILICGDSFAADWRTKITDYLGWPSILEQDFKITNLAQAGCSEYKILKQLRSANLSTYDAIIVFHTSPYRIYVKHHPYLASDPLHNQSDLIYNDIKHHTFADRDTLLVFFEKYFDLTYAEDIHNLICSQINQLTTDINTLHLCVSNNYLSLINCIDVSSIFEKYRGSVNHFNKHGNKLMAQKVKDWINNDIC